MNNKNSLAIRMKENYELRCRPSLIRRTPVIVRVDGKTFHKYTRKMQKPFDPILMDFMAETTLDLCNEIQGAVFAYQQSDEISIFLKDYNSLTSEAWFDYDLCKICSVGASLVTAIFDRIKTKKDPLNKIGTETTSIEDIKFSEIYCKPMTNFDCRAFNIPKEEIVNYFLWRQQDMTRNSIQMAGRSWFDQKQLHKKSCSDIQEMLFSQKNINWNDYSTPEKRGIAVYKNNENLFIIDKNIPIFNQNREFIEKFIPAKET